MTRSSLAKTDRAFYITSFEDDEWLWQQTEAVRMLWSECAKADRFGDEGGAELKSKMKKATFFKAKKIIEEYGAFKFEQFPGTRDGRKTRWFVTNLHGANRKEYWIQSTQVEAISENFNSPTIAEIHSTQVDSKSLSVEAKSRCVDSSSLAVDSISFESRSSVDFREPPDFNQTVIRNKTDLSALSSENRSGRFVGSSPLGGEAAYTSGASDIVEDESGATHQSEDLGRSEPCRTSLESENEHRREEAESTHQPKSSAPPHTILLQSTSRSNEDDLKQDSTPADTQTDRQATEQASTALPGASKPHFFHKVMEEAIRAGLEKGISYPDEFWEWFLKYGRANQLAPVRIGVEKGGGDLDDYIDSLLGDYLIHDASSGNPVYCWNETMKLRIWTH